MTRPWWGGAVIYQVYPRAFADANGDGIGDIAGILAHLDHLAGGPAALGVDAVWLSPIYPHAGVDGGYDIVDHAAVSPEFGTLTDVDRLLAEAHRRGLRVLLDLVPGHTSDRHPWFAESRAGRDAGRRDWYLWADPRPDGQLPTNWVAEFGDPAWTADPSSGQLYHHSFFPEQPDLNWRNPAVRAAMAEVMRFWLDRGVDGFRVDAIESLLKDVRLRDNPPAGRTPRPWSPEPGGLRRRWTRHLPGVVNILRELRAVADAYPGRVLVGEMYAPADRVARVLGGARGGGLHLALDHQLAKSAWDAVAFRRALAAAERHLPPPLAPTWAFSNHDLSRQASRWGPERARLAALILLTLRGTVCLYQGEEIGATDADVPPAERRDRFGRDPARAPLDWDAVAAQRADPRSLLALYRRLIALRRRSGPLRYGSLSLVPAPSGVLAYRRAAGRQRLTVIANMGERPALVQLDEIDRRGRVLIAAGEPPSLACWPRVDMTANSGVVLATT
jgi:alpha-glucosidase